ncbi:MAG: phage tail tape measure protein [Paenibacillus dendritiformis]|uniref:phage tail tape measure protein n=1 Tax=uncultured Paenibacillus sp. TaxID=227322 RepID=UPI0025F66677|nr:phage tail tape measure protein [uncultured Paenibacillus sp.]MDU5143613.1 phage tail tape measure protein [Paenibacillus dendritiformis]
MNDVTLRLSASLDMRSSTKAINQAIRALEKSPSLQTLQLRAAIDPAMLRSLKECSTAIVKQNESVKEAIDSYKKLGKQIEEVNQKAAKGKGGSAEPAAAQPESGASEQKSFGSYLKDAKQSVLQNVAKQLVNAPIEGARQAVQTVIEIDSKMAALRREMDADTNFDRMLDRSVTLAGELGRSLNDVLDTMHGLSRSGWNEQQVMALAETVQLARNISGLSGDEAIVALTAAMSAFQIEAGRSMTILDSLKAVDQAYAVSTRDLALSLTEAGGAARSYGVSMEELIGHTAAIGSITQESGAVIGSSLEAIYESIMKADTSAAALQEAGVSLQDTSGTLKSASSIAEELAGKWNQLSEGTQRYIAQTIAGKDHMQRFMALMANYPVALDAANAALYSEGAAMRDNEAHMQSLEARLATMRTAWQELALTMGEAFISDSLIALISAATALGQTFVWLAERIGTLPLLFGTMAATVKVVRTALASFIGSISQTAAGLLGIGPASATAATGLRGLAAATKMLGRAFKSLMISTGIGALVGLISWGVSELIGLFGDAGEGAENVAQSFERVKESVAQASYLKTLAAEYEELTALEEKSIQAKIRLAQIEDTLRSQFGISVKSLDEHADAQKENNELIKQRIALLQEQIRSERENAQLEYESQKSKFDRKIDETSAKRDRAEEELDKKWKKYEEFLSKYKGKDNENVYYSFEEFPEFDLDPNASDKIYTVKELREKLAGEVKKAKEKWEESNTEFTEAVSTAENAINGRLQSYVDAFESKGEELNEHTRFLTDVLASWAAANRVEISESDFATIFQAFQKADIQNVEDVVGLFAKLPGNIQITGSSLKDLDKRFTQMKIGAGGAADGLDGMASSLQKSNQGSDELRNRIKSTQDELKSFNQILADLEAGQSMSTEAMLDLMAQYPELQKHISKAADGWRLEKEGIQELREEKLKKAKEDLENEKRSTLAAYFQSKARIRIYGVEMGSIKDLADAKKTIGEIEKNRETTKQLANVVTSIVPGAKVLLDPVQRFQDNQLDEVKQKIQDTEEYYKKYEAMLDDAYYGVSRKGTSSSSSGKKDSYQPSLRFNPFEEAIQRVNASLEKNQQQMEEAMASGRQYDKLLEKRIGLYNDMGEALRKLRQSQSSRRSELASLLGSAGLIKNGEVVGDVRARLESISKRGSKTGYSAADYEKFVEEYMELTRNIGDTDLKIDQNVIQLADAYKRRFESRQQPSEKKREKLRHQLALLGDINTAEEKRLAAQNAAENMNALVTEGKRIRGEIDDTEQLIRNSKTPPEQRRAATIYLEWLRDNDRSKQEEIVAEAEHAGQQQAEALIAGYKERIGELEFEKSLLGSLDTEEKQRRAKEIDDQIISIYEESGRTIESQIAELTRKAAAADSVAEKRRAESKRQALQEYQRTVLKQIADNQAAEQKARLDNANKLIDNLKKVLQREKELRTQAIEEEIRTENKRHDAKMKHLDAELKKTEDYINAQLKGLDRANAEEDYDTQLRKLMKERQDIQDRLNVLALDDSFEAKAKKKQLQEQLESKDEEIDKFKLDRERELRKQALSDQLEDRRKIIENEKELEDNQHNDKIAKLDIEKSKIEQHYKGILEDEKYFYGIKQQLLSNDKNVVFTALDEIKVKYGVFFEELAKASERLGQTIADNIKYGFKQDYDELEQYGKSLIPSISGTVKQPGTSSGTMLPGAADQIKNKKLFSAESGGMTPAWGGKQGKFLLAHEKELILNKADSFNLLKVVDITRNIIDSIKRPFASVPALQPALAGAPTQNFHISITGNFAQKDGEDIAKSLDTALRARGHRL